jgi:single-strand DNA-binding protein
MYSLNRATLIGNLTREPEMRQTPGGQAVCSFSIATNRAWTGNDGVKQDATEFHNIVAWGKLADICGQYLSKGKKIYVEGRLQTRDWEGQDGVKRYRTEIVAENLIMLDNKGGAPAGGSSFSAASGAGGFTPPQPKMQDDPSVNVDQEIRMEEIPF